MAKKTNVLWTKFAIAMITLVILAGVAFCIAGLVMSAINGTGFAEEITSWFTKAVENSEETEEIVEAVVNVAKAAIGC